MNLLKKIFQSIKLFRNLQPNKGFTLVEMLVVIAVIGILYGIVMASVSNSKAKGRDAKRIADISIIQLALERYYDEYRRYPTSLSDSNLINRGPIPKDPSGNDYKYSTLNGNNTVTCFNDCQSYHLGATLELYNGVLDGGDEDLNVSGDFNGTDSLGCSGESGKKCYDVIPKF